MVVFFCSLENQASGRFGWQSLKLVEAQHGGQKQCGNVNFQGVDIDEKGDLTADEYVARARD